MNDKRAYIANSICSDVNVFKAPTTPEGIVNLKLIAKGLGVEYDESNNKASKFNLVQAINNI